MNKDKQPYESAEDCGRLSMAEAKAILESICEQNREFYSDRRGIGALKDLQQTFPNPWLYVAELLQNAVDEAATRIALTVEGDATVIFEHNGSAFSPEDVDALCSRGVSAKGANTVGFMGIGFKSVFRSFEEVQISSGPWRFVLKVATAQGEEYGDQQRVWLGAVLPHWDDSAEVPSPGMKCRFVLSKRLPHLPPPIEDLQHVLGENETLLALLSLQGVEELRWNGNLWLLAQQESPLGDAGDQRVMLEALDDKGTLCRRWILFSKNYQPSRQAIARFLEHRQLVPTAQEKEKVYREASQHRKVAVFCEIDELHNPIPPNRGSAFALLPTGVTFPLGLHVQADWLLVVTRREIMQIEGNEWHEEIFSQLPALIRYYVEWLVSDRDRSGQWSRGYDAMPGQPLQEVRSDAWFGGEQFLNTLGEELSQLTFLPKPADAGGLLAFVSPALGRFLPKPFAREFEDAGTRPEVLFGDRIVDGHVLGTRASQCLQRLHLFQEFTAADVAAAWKAGIVSRWIKLFPEDLRNKMLLRILQALVDLENVDEWRDAELVCLPTASGGWTDRDAASRYPPDWNVLAQEDDIRQALDPLVGSPESIIAWDFDSMLQQTRSPARGYLDRISQPKLEEIVNKFWENMPDAPTAEDVPLIVRLTTWVLEKQPQRKSIVKKLLCLEANENGVRLRPTAETLLADPYAGAFRRLFYPDAPVVAPIYEAQGASSTRADWRAFLEKLDPAPEGKSPLISTAKLLFGSGLATFVGENYTPPYHRSGWMILDWRGFKVQYDRYTVIDTCFVPPIADLLVTQSVSPEQFRGLCQWLAESPALLREYNSVLIAYIPYMCNYIQTARVPKRPTWITSLINNRWVYTKNGDGPFRPSDVLSAPDPVRPDAPVADIDAELLQAFLECGVAFGVALPNAPAIDRLRIQGPTASEEQLLRFLQEAIAEAEDESKRDCLGKVLRERPLFQLPLDRAAPDRVTRISHNRLVWSDRTRSALGNWLLPVEYYPEGTLSREIIELVDSFLPIPKTSTFAQVLDFLSWVWTSRPDADLVRRILPRAYAYVKQELQADSSLFQKWNEVAEGACVFVLGKRQWIPVAGTKTLFLDDLNESGLNDLVPALDLATPGHFGDSLSDQVSTAKLLGVSLFSSRFRVVLEPHGPQAVPDHWQRGFSAIQNWLREQVSKGDDADMEASSFAMQNLQLSHWESLQTIVFDSGEPIQRKQVSAAFWKSGNVAVTGMPEHFAEQLCKILFNQWGLRLRRDLVELIPKVAIQLTRINDPGVVERWLSEGVREKSAGSQPKHDAAKGTQLQQPEPVLNSDGVSATVEPGVPSEVVETEKNSEDSPDLVIPGGSYTEDIRESRIRSLIEKKDELDQRIHDAVTLDITPAEPSELPAQHTTQFRSDDVYREAVLRYEGNQQRYAHAKADAQPGHDIDSYTHPEGNPERRLVRRIEVKGRSTRWDLDEIVEMSDTQFKDSLTMSVPADTSIDPDFDYWLYVVERREEGDLRVLPLRNVARQAAHFALKGGSWRYLAEKDGEEDSEQSYDGSAVGAAPE